jgi:chitinase
MSSKQTSAKIPSLILCLFILLLTLAPAWAADESNAAAPASPRLLAYYPDWAKYQTPPYTAEKIPYNKVTHILEAFLLLKDGEGNLYIEPGLIEPALIKKAHAAGVKVMISIGGADPVQANRFSKIAASDTARRTFAENIHAFLDKYGYDGVDIDWEVPNAPKDTLPCILLMESLRFELLAPDYLISMAVPSDPPSYGTGFDIPALAPLVDFLNVMTYDFHGPWSDHAGHNSPLILSPEDPEQEGSVRTSMDLYEVQYGVDRRKLNLGTAFYGYEFDGESALWEYCPKYNCSNTSTWNYGTYIKQRVNHLGWKRHSDPIARAPYLLQEDPNDPPGFLTYDDPGSTARKAQYVLGVRRFGGVFMWDLSGDYDGQSQDLLDAMYGIWQKYQK